MSSSTMASLICLLLLLAMTGYSTGATYCLCKDGVSDQALQNALDYACGNGADCSQIQQNGACYNPNTVKDHCNFAVNSYFQNQGQIPGSCDFAGAASVSPNPPTNIASTCSYPSSSTGTTPTTGPTTGTPPTPTGPTTGTPTTGTPPGFGGGTGTTLGPTGTTTTPGINSPSHAVALYTSMNRIFFTFLITLWVVM